MNGSCGRSDENAKKERDGFYPESNFIHDLSPVHKI